MGCFPREGFCPTAAKKAGYDLGGSVRGGLVGHRGDNPLENPT